jgi:hypothetical protein
MAVPPWLQQQTTRALLLGLLSAALGYFLANSYVGRLSNHRGYRLVAVDDRVQAPRARVPRRSVVVVIDGLGYAYGLGLRAREQLQAQGACYRTYVGVPSVSRPSYAVISTGLEQERTGARNNDEQSPLAAESIWEVFREANRTVDGRSNLGWWRELFPGGFSSYAVFRHQDNMFAPELHADMTLLHPSYVDETAHDHGTLGEEHARDVRRVDQELTDMLRSLDLTQDLVMVTADHGHRTRGGHGGPQPEITWVLSCFAGPGVAHRDEISSMDSRALAPALALLHGLRFPKHMQALGDHLDEAFTVTAAPTPADEAYVAERRSAVARYRGRNQEQLLAWGSPSWRALEASLRDEQAMRGTLAASPFALAIGLVLRRERRWRAQVVLLTLPALAMAGATLVYVLLSGGFDATSINSEAFFVRNAVSASMLGVLLMNAVFVACLRGRVQRLLASVLLVLVMSLGSAAHIAAFGWPLGYPMPTPVLYFAPFVMSVFLFVVGLELAATAAWLRWRGSTP